MTKTANTHLIQGDFRDNSIKEEFAKHADPLSVVSIDCNWLSSIKASFDMITPFLQCGSIIYIDDFFVSTRKPNKVQFMLDEISKSHAIKFCEFMTYPPCGRAYIVEIS